MKSLTTEYPVGKIVALVQSKNLKELEAAAKINGVSSPMECECYIYIWADFLKLQLARGNVVTPDNWALLREMCDMWFAKASKQMHLGWMIPQFLPTPDMPRLSALRDRLRAAIPEQYAEVLEEVIAERSRPHHC